MEDKLASMTQKMLDLQVKYLDLQVQSAGDITSLHQKVSVFTEPTVQKGLCQIHLEPFQDLGKKVGIQHKMQF